MTSTDDLAWHQIAVPRSVSSVPSMLHPEEQQYLIWATAHKYEGFGAIVDLGPWLGGSSVALAHGLRERGQSGRVQSFDLFKWEPHYMQSHFACDLKHGDDFQPLFRKMTAAYADRIDAQQMDLMQGKWNGGPIEILFVDAAKTWGLWRSIVRVFGPSLEPGRSRVIHQDFRHPTCSWLPLTCDSRPDVWQQTEATRDASTVTFTPRRRLRAEEADDLVREDLPWAKGKEVLQRRIATEPVTSWMYRVTMYGEALRHGDYELQAQLAAQLLADRRADRMAGALADETLPWIVIDAGWQACRQGRHDEALLLANQVPATSRAACYAMLMAGHASRAAQQLDRADHLLASAIALQPDSHSAYIEQMWLRLCQHRFAEGEAIGRRLLAMTPKMEPQTEAYALRVLAALLGNQGKFAEALCENERGEALTDRSRLRDRADFLADRALLARGLGRNAEAIAAAKQALELHPGHEVAIAFLR